MGTTWAPHGAAGRCLQGTKEPHHDLTKLPEFRAIGFRSPAALRSTDFGPCRGAPRPQNSLVFERVMAKVRKIRKYVGL